MGSPVLSVGPWRTQTWSGQSAWVTATLPSWITTVLWPPFSPWYSYVASWSRGRVSTRLPFWVISTRLPASRRRKSSTVANTLAASRASTNPAQNFVDFPARCAMADLRFALLSPMLPHLG